MSLYPTNQHFCSKSAEYYGSIMSLLTQPVLPTGTVIISDKTFLAKSPIFKTCCTINYVPL